MKINIDASKHFTGGNAFIANHGDDIWEIVCDEFPTDKPFRTSDVATILHRRYGWKLYSCHRYVNLILRNVAAQPDHVAIRRKGHFWIL